MAILCVVRTHDACRLRLKGHLVLREISVEEIVRADRVAVVPAVCLRGIGSEMLQKGSHLRVAMGILLLHARHHLIPVHPGEEGVLPRKLRVASEARVARNIEIWSKASKPNRVLPIWLKAGGSDVAECTHLIPKDCALKLPGGAVEGRTEASWTHERGGTVAFLWAARSDICIGLNEPEPLWQSNFRHASCEARALATKISLWRDLCNLVLETHAAHEIIQSRLGGH
mmetsp:Transcript_49990/g.99284  ORF Transcript_49990/g.99284 Transcript_49990/m.99284 type:complete len:228 (-) Transcript_49990:166-849(-)